MRYRLIFHQQALEEAYQAAAYIAGKSSVDIASRWLDELEALIQTLDENPRRFGYAREHGDSSPREIRQVLHKSHRVIYAITETAVHVLHVRHSARDNLVADELQVPKKNEPA